MWEIQQEKWFISSTNKWLKKKWKKKRNLNNKKGIRDESTKFNNLGPDLNKHTTKKCFWDDQGNVNMDWNDISNNVLRCDNTIMVILFYSSYLLGSHTEVHTNKISVVWECRLIKHNWQNIDNYWGWLTVPSSCSIHSLQFWVCLKFSIIKHSKQNWNERNNVPLKSERVLKPEAYEALMKPWNDLQFYITQEWSKY